MKYLIALMILCASLRADSNRVHILVSTNVVVTYGPLESGPVGLLVVASTNTLVVVTNISPKPPKPTNNCDGEVARYELEINRWYLRQMGRTSWPKDGRGSRLANHLHLLKEPAKLDISPGAQFRKERGE
jgi:hypothetical protein